MDKQLSELSELLNKNNGLGNEKQLEKIVLNIKNQDESSFTNVVLFTASPYGTMGDVTSAFNLMKMLLDKHSEKIRFSWIIHPVNNKKDEEKINNLKLNVKKFISDNLYLEDKIEYIIFDESAEKGHGLNNFWNNNDALLKLVKSDVCVVYPTAHYITEADHLKITSLGKPFNSITEYDFMPNINLYTAPEKNNKKYSTGFAEDSLGVFCEGMKLDLDFDSIDDALKTLIFKKQSLNKYREKNKLFFGYFNTKEDLICYNTLVDIKEFVITCMNLHENKNIDIVVNMTEVQYKELVDKLFKEELFKGKKFTLNYIKDEKQSEENNVNIINKFPLDKNSMLALINISEPLVGLTGDNSFIEGLMLGKLVFYQQMRWKKDFFENFLKFVGETLGNENNVYKFYDCQNKKTKNNEERKSNRENFIEQYNTTVVDSYKEHASKLSQAIIEKKNIKNNIDALDFINIKQYKLNSTSDKVSISLFTNFTHNRGGDLSAAALFMKNIIKENSNVYFNWIIKKDLLGRGRQIKDFEGYVKDIADNVKIYELKSADYDNVVFNEDGTIKANIAIKKQCGPNNEYINIKKDQVLLDTDLMKISNANVASWDRYSNGGWSEFRNEYKNEESALYKLINENTDIICSVATLHRFVEEDRNLFQIINKPFVAMSEYNQVQHINYRMPDGLKNKLNIKSGFGKDASGVYIDDEMLTKDTLINIKPDNKFLVSHLIGDEINEANIEKYLNTHSMFYGYFFTKPDGTNPPEWHKSIVKINSYIKACIELSLDENKCIDIVIPGLPDNMFEKICEDIEILKYKRPVFISSRSGDELSSKAYEVEDNKEKYDTLPIRLISSGRITRHTIQCLLNSSEPLCALTGDQSFVEGLVKGKLICYQAMKWKRDELKAFIEDVKFFNESDSKKHENLYNFYHNQISENHEESWKKITSFYKADKDTMKASADILSTKIIKDKNLMINNKNEIKNFIKLFAKKDNSWSFLFNWIKNSLFGSNENKNTKK